MPRQIRRARLTPSPRNVHAPARTRTGDQVLLTGASGFVGRRLAPVLEAIGWDVRWVSRNDADMQHKWPRLSWLQADLSQSDDAERVLAGCRVAFYLMHSLGLGQSS